MRDVKKVRGFVAVIDVLGFREMVTRSDDLLHVTEYVTTVRSLFENQHDSKLQFVLFSDNLIVNTTDDSELSFDEIVRACSRLFYELTDYQIAIRGAISHGWFMRSETTEQGVILAGRPIIEALYYQDQQDWLGIILSPSVLRNDESIQKLSVPWAKRGESDTEYLSRNRLPLRLQRWPLIPFHPTQPPLEHLFDGYAVVPLKLMSADATQTATSLASTRANLEKMRAAAPDPRSQQKYSATLKWVKTVQDRCAGNLKELELGRRS